MSISDNIKNIKNIIAEEEKKAGRAADSVKLMAVSKFHSADEIEEAVNAGIRLFGENRVQEADSKFPALIQKYPDISLHMIGSLQRNKVKDIVKIATCIESVDRMELLEEIEKQCAKIDKTISVLFEVHTGEESKSGFTTEKDLEESIAYSLTCPHIEPAGFMTMAPFTDNQAEIKASFEKLVAVAEKMKAKFPSINFTELSMGMSNDYKLAIPAGSTIVRIGTAIFGERKKV